MYWCFRLRRSWHEPDLERRGPDLERRVSEDATYGRTLSVRDEFDTSMTLPEETNSDTESATTPTLTVSSPTAADNIYGNGQQIINVYICNVLYSACKSLIHNHVHR